MYRELTEDEKFVRDELSKIFPQLKINLQKVCGGGAKNWADDLLQLSCEIFLDKTLKEQLKIIADGKLEHYITHVANFQLKRGKTTKFYHTHRKFLGQTRELFSETYRYNAYEEMDISFDDEDTTCVKCIKMEIRKLNPFQKMVLKEKIEWGYTYKEIADKYDIPYSNLQQELKSTLKKINNICKQYI